jgi:cytidine deaminase
MHSKLIQVAQDARKKAYAQYSNFHVGAALESSSGKIYPGCNVENASYSLTMCAERTALFSAVAAGEKKFTHLVVATENGVSPCGACRQVIWELCGDIPITLVDESGSCKETSSSELLPQAFGQKDLGLT